MAELQKQFESYAEKIKNAPSTEKEKIDDSTKLKFYMYYKQATVGDINTTKPTNSSILSLFPSNEQIKWDGWNSLKGVSKEEAMQTYIMLAKQHL